MTSICDVTPLLHELPERGAMPIRAGKSYPTGRLNQLSKLALQKEERKLVPMSPSTALGQGCTSPTEDPDAEHALFRSRLGSVELKVEKAYTSARSKHASSCPHVFQYGPLAASLLSVSV